MRRARRRSSRSIATPRGRASPARRACSSRRRKGSSRSAWRRTRPPPGVRARRARRCCPGRDPLEAAVAAGETPSPEMVAAAATVGDLSAGRAWLALTVVLGGLVLAAWLADHARPPPARPAPEDAGGDGGARARGREAARPRERRGGRGVLLRVGPRLPGRASRPRPLARSLAAHGARSRSRRSTSSTGRARAS